MTEWEPKFVEPDAPFKDVRQVQYREITIWHDLRDGRLYQFICIERTPPGDFFVALCVFWKDSIFVRLQPDNLLSLVRRKMRQFITGGGPTYPTLEAAIAAYDITQAEKG